MVSSVNAMGSRSFFLTLISVLCVNVASYGQWKMEDHGRFRIHYKELPENEKSEYVSFVEKGMNEAGEFFAEKFKSPFDVYVHPHRASLDSTWQHDWKMPEFKSECWMVASGVANKLDVIRPALWEKESCEHTYSNKEKVQQLITHELVHVFHGQHNVSPDFSTVSGIDWFVEGLATFVAGQANHAARKDELRLAIQNGNIPASLDQFWKGKLRYSQSGSL